MTDGEFDELVSIVADHFGLYGRLLTPETNLATDLEADDIDRRELLVTIEEVFALRFTEQELDELANFASIAAAIDNARRASSRYGR